MTLIQGLDYASVAVFAVTGALVASRSQLDVVGFIFVACLTAVGGGTLRDVLLDRDVFWIVDPVILLLASVAAVGVFFTAHLLESRYRAILWVDALALATNGVIADGSYQKVLNRWNLSAKAVPESQVNPP